MPITTFDDLFTKNSYTRVISKNSTTVVAGEWYTTSHLVGTPAPNGLANGDDVFGRDPSPDFLGPQIGAAGSATWLQKVTLESSVALRARLVDVLYLYGSHPATAGTLTPTTPPTISRVYDTNELWVWSATAITGTLSLNVTYKNQAGVSKSTGVVATTLTGALGRMFRIPLAAGDTRITQIESVVRSGATAGSFMLLVLAPVWRGRVPIAGGLVTDGMDRTGLIPVPPNAMFIMMVNADSTASGLTELTFTQLWEV